MKNLVSWRYIVGIFAIAAISLTGMLLSQQPADATGATGWLEMEANDRNYDWGNSKPNGSDPGYEDRTTVYAENRHRAILDDEFKVQTLQEGNRLNIKINVPQQWSYFRRIPFATLNYNVEYEIEEAYHRTVSNPSDCSPVSARTNTPIPSVVGSLEQVESTITLGDADLAAYSCVIVKLKGGITGGGLLPDSDTHPEWAFVSPVQITQMADRQETSAASDDWSSSDDWPEVRVVSSEESIRIYSLAGASGLRFHFKYRILDEGDRCDQSAFAVTPNHPAVHHSTQFNIPDSPETRAYYHNRYVCFQATIVNIDHPAYAPGASIYRYRNVRIGLDFPVISVTRHSSWRSAWPELQLPNPDAYLQLESSEVVTYRMRIASVAAASDGAASCQSFFEGLPSFDTPIMDASGKFMINAIGKVAPDGICLEATDLDGNKVYSWIYDSTAGMAFVVKRLGQFGEEFHGWVGGTSGDVFWHVASPSESDTCNESNSFEGDGIQALNSDRPGFIFKPGEGSRGKYYCFRATDELGNHFYRSMIHVEQQYIMPA